MHRGSSSPPRGCHLRPSSDHGIYPRAMDRRESARSEAPATIGRPTFTPQAHLSCTTHALIHPWHWEQKADTIRTASKQMQTHRLGGLPIFAKRLTNPNLGHPFCIDRRHGSMQRICVQLPVHEPREKNDRGTFDWPDLEVDAPVNKYAYETTSKYPTFSIVGERYLKYVDPPSFTWFKYTSTVAIRCPPFAQKALPASVCGSTPSKCSTYLWLSV